MDILKYKEIIDKANREGFAGCMPNGNLVDRREYPEAYPVAENKMFNVTAPRCIKCEEVTPMFQLKESLCKKCNRIIENQNRITVLNFDLERLSNSYYSENDSSEKAFQIFMQNKKQIQRQIWDLEGENKRLNIFK